ncbi:MAG TPA: sugar phosphate nucleotidyltransferase [Ardenticatenaceae bacterium]|nr:sugar phosphate nucleotidyltransferase [Ardenticatenaceae bacterium]
MHVIIPTAGYGTRLRPHTYSKPKPLVKVAGKAVLGHVLDMLTDLDIDELTFIVGYLGDQIRAYVGQHYNFKTNYVEQKELKGQAHAIRLTREFVNGPVLIIFVDTIFEADLKSLAGVEDDGVIFVKEVEDPRRFGVVTLDSAGHITRFVEKPSQPVSNLAVIGVYYVKDHQLLFRCIDALIERNIQTKGEFFLADALQLMVEEGASFQAWTVDVWEDCGTAEAVLHTNRYLLETGHATTTGDGTNSVIVPPVHIAPGVEVVNSIVGPFVSLAEGSQVLNSIVRDTIVDEGAQIESTVLDRSLIGKDALVRGRYRKLNVGDSSEVDFTT